MRTRTAIRAAAWATVALGVAAPLVRRRAKLPPVTVTAASAVAPLALCVVVPRSRARRPGRAAADELLCGDLPDAQRR
ncbi:MAG: hypothetical protein ACXVFN_21450, partial [Solirubrobacteraceae bacterium]